jgi:arsenite methyltransferase
MEHADRTENQKHPTMKTLEPDIEKKHDQLRTQVREHYATVAEKGTSCCAPTCCSPKADGAAAEARDANARSQRLGYSVADTAAVPPGSNLGLGCGNPLAIALLRRGQTVLDLGSGAGFDAFLAARAVGPEGRVIGVDMTPAMLTRARENAVKAGISNTEFRMGEIENLPVADASVDVILSNCVINLSPDKGRVFREAFRVLKAGGRLAISDIVALKPVPGRIREDVKLHAGCAAGAALVGDLRDMLTAAGFTDIRITPKLESRDVIRDWFPGLGLEDLFASATVEGTKPVTA